MANAILMYHCLGVPADDPRLVTAWAAVEKLVMDRADQDGVPDETYVQPCLSPIWDTALVAHALMEAGGPAADAAVDRGLTWLLDRQVTDVAGDWAEARPGVPPGGWAFQYANPHYPDVDDTAVVVLALDRARKQAGLEPDERSEAAIERATEWVVGMQSKGGGWGAFDADNTHHHLNSIPFADHGALLDPPTADVSGRCLAMLAQLGHPPDSAVMKQAVEYLLAEQEPDGAWYGRWGVNYVYGTWSAVTALNAAGLAPEHPAMRKAVAWLKAAQNPDGGWGEDGFTYPRRGGTRADPDRDDGAEQRQPDRLGAAGADGGGGGGGSGGGPGRALAAGAAGGGRVLAGGRLYRHRFPAGFLPALPRLCAAVPVLGAGPAAEPAAGEFAAGGPRIVANSRGWAVSKRLHNSAQFRSILLNSPQFGKIRSNFSQFHRAKSLISLDSALRPRHSGPLRRGELDGAF